MKTLARLFLGTLLVVSLCATLVVPARIMAATPAQQACEGTGGKYTAPVAAFGVAGRCSTDGGTDLPGAFKTIANTLIFLVGAISVIMIIIGGLRYVLSGGDSAGIKGAKDTILYAAIGVAVAILAYAIVNFVISRLA